jgi:hypothetical protein
MCFVVVVKNATKREFLKIYDVNVGSDSAERVRRLCNFNELQHALPRIRRSAAYSLFD